MQSKRLETFTPGPWHIPAKSYCRIVAEDGSPIANTVYRGKPLFSPYGPMHGAIDENNPERAANGLLIAAAPDMYAGNEDAMITLDLMAQTGGLICAECPWGKKCKTCALSEVLRLGIALRKRIENIRKKARGEKDEMES